MYERKFVLRLCSLEALLIWSHKFRKDLSLQGLEYYTIQSILNPVMLLKIRSHINRGTNLTSFCDNNATAISSTHICNNTNICPANIGQDFTNWLQIIHQPCHFNVKQLLSRIKGINKSLHFLPFFKHKKLNIQEIILAHPL